MSTKHSDDHRVAFCTVPHYGGFFSVYNRIRTSVAGSGWDVRSVQIGDEHHRWNSYDASLAGPEHVTLEVANPSLIDAAKAFVDWVQRESIKVVIPMSSPAALAALPHLPPQVAVITRCGNITPNAYRLVTTCIKRTDRFVVTSPRQYTDLIRRYGVPEERVCHIPNAVDITRFHAHNNNRHESDKLHLVVLDRIDHRQKRTDMIPGVLRRLDQSGVPFTLTVIGDGPDLAALRNDLMPWLASDAVRLLGSVPVDSVPDILAETDVLLKMSRNEGFPSALIEAMAAGVVPIVSRISGVTDWIVRDGETGLLCPMDDEDAFAKACIYLHHNQDRISKMAAEASSDVSERFGLGNFGQRWASVFTEAVAEGLTERPVRPWAKFTEPALSRGTMSHHLFWKWLPRQLKDDVRARWERLRAYF